MKHGHERSSRRWVHALAVVSVVALLVGMWSSVALAGPGSGDRVDWYWVTPGQQLCFKVTNLAPKGKPIYDFHVLFSGSPLRIATIFRSPIGWAGTASPPSSAEWHTDASPIKMKASLADFCVNVGGGDGTPTHVKWWTTDRAGGTISSGDFEVT